VVAALWLLSVAFPQAWPRGLLVQGAVFGAASGLLAVGLVLTYRTTRLINFAYGGMGACAAEVGVVAYQRFHQPWLVCVVLACLVGGALGVGVDLVLRRFGDAPRLVVTVATVGLLQVFVGLQFGLAFWTKANVLVPRFPTGLSTKHWAVGTTLFTGNDVVAIAIVPVALVGLSWFLLRTDVGTAVRALADNGQRAMLLGVPTRRLSRLVWVLVGVLGAAVFVLNAPMNGLPSSPFVSTGGVFMPALAAAVVAKMEDLPVAFAGGVALGVFNSVVGNNVHKTALGMIAMLVVVLAALLLRRWTTSRAEAAESSWSLSGARRELPPEVARLPEVVVGRVAVLGVLAAMAIAFPLVASPARVHTVSGYVVLALAVLSIVVLSGWSGTVSLGQYAIVGVGAVVAGNLLVKQNLDLFYVLVLAALGGAVVSVVVGLPALRVRPLFLAVTTLLFAAVMDQYVLNPSNYPDWIAGTIDRPVLWKRFPLESERAMYFLCVGTLVFAVLVARLLRRARPGRVLLAARDNELAAGAMAVSATRVRVGGMALAGMVAGLAGALFAVLENGVGGSAFPPQTSVLVFSMAVVGGLSSISGSLLGVAAMELLVFLIGLLSSQGAQLAGLGTGSLLLVVLIAFPGGVGEAVDRVRDVLARAVARRHGIAFEVGAAAGSLDLATTTVVPATEPVAGALLSCRGLTASYGPLQVLFGVDLDVAPGEIVALLGTNGAGKSTVFKALTGLLASTGGEATFESRSLRGLATDEVARLGIGMMPGGRGVFPTLTVDENLRLAAWQLRGDPAAAERARRDVEAMFPILAARAGQQAGNLSGGEQQQLSLAMALVPNPSVLLIDELSLGLAPTIVGMLCDKVAEIHAAGTTVVLVEQSVNVALQLAERAVFLEKGSVRFAGPTAELLDRGDVLRSVFIGEVPEPKRTRPLVAASNGGGNGRRRKRHTDLVCEGVVKRFGGITVLDDLHLEVDPGAVVGLIGHNGAGKTTLFDVISGFQVPERGRVVLGGVDVTDAPPNARAVAGLGRSFQEARLFPSLTVHESMLVALDRHLRSRDWVAAGLALPASVDAERDAGRRAAEVVELLGLRGFAATPIADLSTGTRRIVELACVLASDPAVVLLDEPTAGVAQRDAEALGPLLRRVQVETGSAILVIEHDMTLLSSLCDQLVAMELGRVIATGTPAEVLAHPRVVESYLGTNEAAVQRSGPVGAGHR
jgi:ABC-type branched-subunit amino acid transport system ATPase component/ABC-type branched-subunit amino acid transport system permease subunit